MAWGPVLLADDHVGSRSYGMNKGSADFCLCGNKLPGEGENLLRFAALQHAFRAQGTNK